MEVITFEQIPATISRVLFELENIKEILHAKEAASEITDQWYDLEGFCNYHPEKPAKPTVYNWVHTSFVPHHKRGKKLYFLKSEIDTWLKQGRKKTNSEIEAEADNYLSNRKGKN